MPSPITEDLLPVAHAARQARDVVTEACLRWELDHLLGPATLIASELVSNVVVHARTMMTLEVVVRGSFLRLTVHDGNSSPPVLRSTPSRTGCGGLGLYLVAHSSADWGYTRAAGGKSVWATLAVAVCPIPAQTLRGS